MSMPFTELSWTDVGSDWRRRFGCRVSKIILNTGLICRHRAGGVGCLFCDETAILPADIVQAPPIESQIKAGRQHLEHRYGPGKYIAYFQRGTNTAAPVQVLRRWFLEAAGAEDVVALAIGTRPDCLPKEVVALLEDIAVRKPVFLELGLQTAHDATLLRIQRGHTAACFAEAVRHLALRPGILVVAHMILGLPGEDREMMQRSFRFLAELPLYGVKIHHLQVVRGTPLEAEYQAGRIDPLAEADYPALLADVLEELPSTFTVHRLMGDVPKRFLVAPIWKLRKDELIRRLKDEFKRRGTTQGFRFVNTGAKVLPIRPGN